MGKEISVAYGHGENKKIYGFPAGSHHVKNKNTLPKIITPIPLELLILNA